MYFVFVVGAGVTWETLWTEYYSYSFGYALLFLLFDSFLFLAAAWYLDRVWPHAQGQRLAPWFCVLPSYWRPKAYNNCTKKIDIRDEDDAAILNKEKKNVGENFEVLIPEQERLVEEKRSVAVRGLRKEFGTVGCGSAVKVAVDGLEMTLVEGEIFVLLGHNGAGKTTTISMLTGLLPLTSGKASILGRDISTDMIAIRKSLGVCPQQNVLFDDLTVIEHLSLYGGIKGLSPAECRTQGYERLKDVALEAKVYSLPSQLSGGQKRKLCLAISMMGDSKVLFLDEPTSGMDVFAQRSTWNLLQKSKAG
jgi:ABC-type Na+ transport system ATPase subunit NatA